VVAFVGAGSALLLDYAKSRRDESQQWQASRREVYVAYLTELSKAYESLWALTLGDIASHGNLVSAARQVLRDGELFQTRQRLKIIAPAPVIAACDTAYDQLRSLRGIVGEGTSADSSAFTNANQVYRDAVRRLHLEIRKDLRVPGPPSEVP
jgi:hypothetical protein